MSSLLKVKHALLLIGSGESHVVGLCWYSAPSHLPLNSPGATAVTLTFLPSLACCQSTFSTPDPFSPPPQMIPAAPMSPGPLPSLCCMCWRTCRRLGPKGCQDPGPWVLSLLVALWRNCGSREGLAFLQRLAFQLNTIVLWLELRALRFHTHNNNPQEMHSIDLFHLFSYNFHFIMALRHCSQCIAGELLFLVSSWNHSYFCLVPHILPRLWSPFPETSSKSNVAKQLKY